MKGKIIKGLVVLAVLLFIGMNISLPSEEASAEDAVGTATISIIGPTDIGKILDVRAVEIKEDDKVLDVLIRITRREEIQMDFRGSGAGAYVEGIGNLYEFDRGPESGWMYKVNDSFPNRSAGTWPVEPGDHLKWAYTLNLGKDVGAYPDGKQRNGEDN